MKKGLLYIAAVCGLMYAIYFFSFKENPQAKTNRVMNKFTSYLQNVDSIGFLTPGMPLQVNWNQNPQKWENTIIVIPIRGFNFPKVTFFQTTEDEVYGNWSSEIIWNGYLGEENADEILKMVTDQVGGIVEIWKK